MIGYGSNGQSTPTEYRRIRWIFPRVEIVPLKTVCATELKKVRHLRNKWGYEVYETDWKAVIATRRRLMQFDICTPTICMQYCMRCGGHGKMVTFEKPLARSVLRPKLMVRRH